jgi:L-lactate dehydrogenase complex protein LldF
MSHNSHNGQAKEHQPQDKGFHPRVHDAITNPQIRANFRKAMDGLMDKRLAAFPDDDDLQTMRTLAAAIRLRALSKLPELLEKLEENLTANGVKVHWAEDGDQACQIILDICQQKNAKSVIKGKSMVSEEMELNHYLEEHGIEALESDLGEYIVQLAEETPSHIIMPAIHKNTDEISDLMHDKTGTKKISGCRISDRRGSSAAA